MHRPSRCNDNRQTVKPTVPCPSLSSGAVPITHYENFPVASWLCPPRLRAPIAALYHFARTADDLADEGDAMPAQRLQALAAYREDLQALGTAQESAMLQRTAWPQVFGALALQARAHQLPQAPMLDLLSAFCQDVRKTDAGASYADRAELLRAKRAALLAELASIDAEIAGEADDVE